MKCRFACLVFAVLLRVLSASGQTIDSFTPQLGSPGDKIQIMGSGFAAGMVVRFWDEKTASAPVSGSTQIAATVPAGATTGPISVQNPGGTENFSGTEFTIVGPGPYITDFSPAYGKTNTMVTINGVHFTNAPVVRFNGTVAIASPNGNGTTITAYVPSGAQTGPISVSTSKGSFTNPNPFTVVGAAPYVASFSPGSGPVGTVVQLNGLNFTTVSSSGVKFNGITASNVVKTSDTVLKATVPNGAMSGPITVVNSYGSFTTTNFYMLPQITSLSPGSGRSFTNVTITGSSFTNASSVTFNGLSASFTVNSDTQISAVAPVGVTSGTVLVSAPAGTTPPGHSFVVLPTVSGFSPGFGLIGSSVTITGANFTSSSLKVFFNGVQANPPTGVTFNSLTAIVPVTTTGPVTVSTVDGSATSSQIFYLPPGIRGFNPNNSAPGTTVVITGTNLLGATAVSFNGVSASCTPPTVNSNLSATVPVGFSTGPISVTTPGGMATSSALFFAPPIIASFNPTHGLPGTNVTILGGNFQGATDVTFNGTPAFIYQLTNGSALVATVPNGATTGPIEVTGPAGNATTTTNFFLDYFSSLAVLVTASPSPVFVGSNLVYSISVDNNGPLAAPNVVLTETLPASVILVSATNSQGTLNISGNPIIANFGTLGLTNSATLTLTVTPQIYGTITNTATVKSSYTDPNPANDTNVLTTVVLPLPFLFIAQYSPDEVILSWLAALSNFSLESSPDFGTNDWTPVAGTPILSGNMFVVIDTDFGAAKYYRLVWAR